MTIIHNKQYYTFKDTHEFTRKSIVYFDVIFYFNQKIPHEFIQKIKSVSQHSNNTMEGICMKKRIIAAVWQQHCGVKHGWNDAAHHQTIPARIKQDNTDSTAAGRNI